MNGITREHIAEVTNFVSQVMGGLPEGDKYRFALAMLVLIGVLGATHMCCRGDSNRKKRATQKQFSLFVGGNITQDAVGTEHADQGVIALTTNGNINQRLKKN